MQEYLNFWKNYVNFSGRSSRRDYWMFFLINLIIVAILFSLARLAHPLMVLYGLYGVATIIPNIAIMIRRLHDIGRSGWWLFIYFIPLVGPIIIIVWMATRSAPDNQWGPSNRVA